MNLESEQDRKQFAKIIKDKINAYCEEKYYEGHRRHLGASIMGNECSRQLWYIFRWIKEDHPNGRMQRLFDVGRRAEERFAMYLEAAGFKIELTDANLEQYRISAHNGHYGGSLDGLAFYPVTFEQPSLLSMELTSGIKFLLEFKTNGTGAGYANIEKNGMRKEKPKHYAQMCQYGAVWKIKYGLYLIENKNDSDITIEIVPLDWNYGQELINKAGDIINSQVPPPKVATSEVYIECKFCNFNGICWKGEAVEKNCRSCKYATPDKDKKWYCNYHLDMIPEEWIKNGCKHHTSING